MRTSFHKLIYPYHTHRGELRVQFHYTDRAKTIPTTASHSASDIRQSKLQNKNGNPPDCQEHRHSLPEQKSHSSRLLITLGLTEGLSIEPFTLSGSCLCTLTEVPSSVRLRIGMMDACVPYLRLGLGFSRGRLPRNYFPTFALNSI